MNEPIPHPCNECGGSGRVLHGYATRSMAMDGGDMSLEGMPIEGPCGCDGGVVWEMPEDGVRPAEDRSPAIPTKE